MAHAHHVTCDNCKKLIPNTSQRHAISVDAVSIDLCHACESKVLFTDLLEIVERKPHA